MSYRPWTEKETALLVRLYPCTATNKLAKMLRRSETGVFQKAYNMDLRKNVEYLASEESGRIQANSKRGGAARFPKGNVPWNKGTQYIAGGRSAETRFKAGSRPHTWKPIGTLRLNDDGYLQRKVADTGDKPRDWRSVHALVWEAEYGPIPEGSIAVFRAGRKTTDLAAITADAVEVLDRAQLMRRNSVHRLPKELARLVQLCGALNRQINLRTK